MPLMINTKNKVISVPDNLVADCLLRGFKFIGEIPETKNIVLKTLLLIKQPQEPVTKDFKYNTIRK